MNGVLKKGTRTPRFFQGYFLQNLISFTFLKKKLRKIK
jgi:hypothetical protein